MRTARTNRVKSSMKLAVLLLTAGCGLGVSSQPHKTSGTPGTCDDPEGPMHPYKHASEVEQLMVGRWRHCAGPALLDQGDVGVEFAADHSYHELGDDGAGGLTQLSGFGHQGTWATEDLGSTAIFEFNPTPNSFNNGTPQFEDDPRRFAIVLLHRFDSSIYVWTGE